MLPALTPIATFVPAQTLLPAQSIHQELKRRLTDYETREPKSPAALAAIAQFAIEGNLRAKMVDVWLEACASPFGPATASCDQRLWETVTRPGARGGGSDGCRTDDAAANVTEHR